MSIFKSDLADIGSSNRLAALAAGLRQRRAGWGAPGRTEAPAAPTPPTIGGRTGPVEVDTGPAPGQAAPAWLNFVPPEVRSLVAAQLPAGLPDYLGGAAPGFGLAGNTLGHSTLRSATPDVPEGAQFLPGVFSNAAGSRPYKLYVPSGYHGQQVALVVMLHGCTQSPDDFARGTGMNAAAEEQTFLVVYPGQTASANAQRCWNWFSAEDQRRDSGEASLIAGITRQIQLEYAVDPRRVYVAGLSAGGAAAAIMGEAYPDLYAAIGVHSGLACGAASDLPSALAAMKRGRAGAAHRLSAAGAQRRVPAIVFHGDRDTTVSPRNGDDVVAQSAGARSQAQVQTGQAAGGHAYSRTVHLDEAGQPTTELWLVHGAGHAWSGGSAAGSYTDPHGPDATREMLRFFWEHPHPAPAAG